MTEDNDDISHMIGHMLFLSNWFPGELINEKDRCKTCKGKKVVQETKTLEVHVDKGMKDEQKITLHGQGDQLVRVTYFIIHEFMKDELSCPQSVRVNCILKCETDLVGS